MLQILSSEERRSPKDFRIQLAIRCDSINFHLKCKYKKHNNLRCATDHAEFKRANPKFVYKKCHSSESKPMEQRLVRIKINSNRALNSHIKVFNLFTPQCCNCDGCSHSHPFENSIFPFGCSFLCCASSFQFAVLFPI